MVFFINIQENLDDAINRADFNEVKTLVEQGANIEYRDPFGCTALMNASWVAAVDIVEYLLSIGADSSAKNNDQQTALDMVKSIGHNDYGHDDVIRLLVEHNKKN